MKKLLPIITALFILIATTCEKSDKGNEELTGNVAFSFNENSLLKSTLATITHAKKIIVSIENEDGTIIFDFKAINLFRFNNVFLSEPIALRPGNYKVTTFFVVADNDSILYLTPREGSELAYLVADPLPVNFSVLKDQTTKVAIEVISATIGKPEDFGYATFSFEKVETFNLLISIFIFDEDSNNFKLTDANLSVYDDNNKFLLESQLQSLTNCVVLRDGLSNYTISVVKEGYQKHEICLTEEELKNYSEKPLTIILFSGTSNRILIGLVDNKLVSIDKATSKLNLITELKGVGGINFQSLTFVENEFYTFHNHTNNPSLYKISISGEVDYIGNLTLDGNQIKLCEGIAYNNSDGCLYISASVNSGTDEFDYYSESFLKVDKNTGKCEHICDIKTDVPNPDIDAMVIDNNILYFYDGAPPGADYSKIYKAELNDINHTIMQPVFETNYLPAIDIAFDDYKLYFVNQNQFYYYDLSYKSRNYIGQTHTPDEFNNQSVKGITFVNY